ncbi:MAG: sugar phosphate isomerase/epimerase [Lachnospiraceae bacterium]|nr:sugar phosphate isomerase/epimerase [Lachnospiraceae bacterium]
MILECIPEYQKAEAWAQLAEEQGLCFEYNEFFNPRILEDKDRVKEIIRTYKNLGRDTSEDTVHGAFLDITVSSSDPLIQNASDYRVRQSIEIAEELGARGVVFHTNYLSDFKSKVYRERWTERNIEYWRGICRKYPLVNIYFENMFDDTPELLKKVAEGMRDIPNFGACLDIAHAFLSEVSESDWAEALNGYVKHMHINDNDGQEDLHLPVGSGKIDWSILKDERLFTCNPSILIEVSGMDRLAESLRYLRSEGILL